MRGDGFEWAVHEAVAGGESRVLEPIHEAMSRASKAIRNDTPQSLMFGHERARYLGFLDAVVDGAGEQSYILPEGSGRPFHFGPWVAAAAQGVEAEPLLPGRIQKIWKTDLFLSTHGDVRYLPATVKSNFDQLEGGRGLRIGIVPESTNPLNRAGVRYSKQHNLWVVTLADPNGFMGLFNDANQAVCRALIKLGKLELPAYWTKPSAKAQIIEEQLLKYPGATVLEIEDALNAAAQQDLVVTDSRLIGVNAPGWLHMKKLAPKIISAKPKFVKL